jgi:hypothetical protein
VQVTSYAGRLKKAFAPDDFRQLFRTDLQPGLFDRPLEEIQPLWARCAGEARPSTAGASGPPTASGPVER